MDFDLRKYLQNNPLTEDLQKNKWTKLDKAELNQYKDDIFALIDKAYEYIGGHPNYNSPEDVTGAEVDANYEVINLDQDPEIDAVSVSKKKSAGTKFTASGHDGTSPAKRSMIKHKIDRLKTPGYYIEVSGRIKDILLNAGVPIVDNPETIKKVLAGKEIKINPDGSYQRKIGAKVFTKILLGKPLV